MRSRERADCSRFPGGSLPLKAFARAPRVAHRATGTDGAIELLTTVWVFAVIARLILINQPFIDHWSWRQSDVAAIARNFFENGFDFAHPQIDWAGDAAGYVGTEFPILPFVAAICYKFMGVHEWIGRSQAVIFFAVSLPFFFLLVREVFGRTAAVWATFFFGFAPLNIFASRSFMPDTPSLSLSIIGFYFFLRWVRDRDWTPLAVAAITISLSILIKATTIVIFAPLAYLAVTGIVDPGLTEAKPPGSRDPRSRLQLVLFAAITLVPSAIWYWHAYQVAERFYPYHFFGAGGIRIENFSWYWGIVRETATSSLTPVLSAMALVGLITTLRWKHSLVFHWWLAGMILFIVFTGYGNRHRWYQLPLVPITAALAGAGCAVLGAKLYSRLTAILLSILLVVTFAIVSYQSVRPFYESSAAQLRDAGLQLHKITSPGALIVAADTGDPTIFYYAHRKGWHFLQDGGIYDGNPNDSEQAIANLEELRGRGATHVVFTINTLWWTQYYAGFAEYLRKSAMVVATRNDFVVYQLKLSND